MFGKPVWLPVWYFSPWLSLPLVLLLRKVPGICWRTAVPWGGLYRFSFHMNSAKNRSQQITLLFIQGDLFNVD